MSLPGPEPIGPTGGGGGGAALSDNTPEPLGSESAGVGTEASRWDHIHPMPSAADVGALGLTAQAADSAKLAGVTPTAAGLALLGDADAAAQRTTMGLGDSATKNVGTSAGTVAAGDDSRLSNARTPTAHAPSHKSGGSDEIKLDELAAPTDVTTLNASASAHGLLPKLSGSDADALRGDGTWGAVGAVPLDATRIAQAALANAFSTFPGVVGFTTGTGLTTGNLRARPWVPGKAGTLTALGLLCSLGVATAKARIGIYDSDSNGYPGTLLAESGELDCSTNGRKLTTGLSVSLNPAKVYWVAFIGGTANPNLAVMNTNLYLGVTVAAAATSAAVGMVGLTVVQAYGSMPGTFPAGAAGLSTATNVPVPLLLVS